MTQFNIPPKPTLKKRKTPPRKTQYAIMPLRALTDKRITDRNRTVLAMMSSFANRAGITWVTQKRIGEEFKVTPQAIQRMLGKLRDCGYIEKVSGYKVGIKGITYRIIYDPKISAQDAVSIAGNGIDLEVEQYNQEDPVMTFRNHQPQPISAFLKDIPMAKPKQQNKTQQQEVEQVQKVYKAEDYSRIFSLTAQQICGVERLPNEQDREISIELATNRVDIDQFRQMLVESISWHKQTGKQPPLGLGYYKQVALSLRKD
jgi:hypothetical protein